MLGPTPGNTDLFDKYGLEWDLGVTDTTIELKCYRYFDQYKAAGGEVVSAYFHLLEAIRLLWTKDGINPNCDFRISNWTEDRTYSFTTSEFQPQDEDHQDWWGCASAGKSTDGGIILLTHWLAAPDETSVTICSTTKEMLQQRIWGEMIKYYSLYKGTLPGRYMSSKTQITLGDENSKNCIRGIAVLAGSAEEAKNNIIGVHNIYNALCVDELQHPKMAPAMDAITNLSTGCKEFKFLGMGNPDSWLNPLGIDSEPQGGKEEASTEKKGWATKRGKCLYYDGLKSPGIVDPEKFPFLLQQRDIDKTINDFGEDHPQFWQMRRGFIAPAGLTNTVLTEAMLTSYGMQADPEWLETPLLCAGIDPAWSSGGNNCIIYPFFVGMAKPGVKVAAFLKPHKVQFEASTKDALTIFLAKKLIEYCKINDIPPERVGMDTSVSQFMLADIMESDLFKFKGLYRCDFGGRPSDDRVSENDGTMASELYLNRVTELWYMMVNLGRSCQIRNLKDYDTCRQFTTRKIKDSGTRKIGIESKKDMKARNNGNSPDEADAAVAGLAMARQRLNLIPAGLMKAMIQSPADIENFKKYDLDGREDSYLKDNNNDPIEELYEEEAIYDLSNLI